MLGAGLPVGPLSPPRKTKARTTAGLFGTCLLRVAGNVEKGYSLLQTCTPPSVGRGV